MSLNICLTAIRKVEVFDTNITHNLGKMAEAAGIYYHLWRPEEIGIKTADELIGPLTEGLAKLRKNPRYFRQFNSQNGWGTYDNFVRIVEEYLNECIKNPDAEISVSR